MITIIVFAVGLAVGFIAGRRGRRVTQDEYKRIYRSMYGRTNGLYEAVRRK